MTCAKQFKRGMLLVLSGPSGTGKGTLADQLIREDPTFRFSVSATTRAPRNYEIDGVHYHFLTEEAFAQKVAEHAFLEHAVVHGHQYGTLRQTVINRLNNNENVLLDIDPQGARAVAQAMPECVTVFILPPSYEELSRRLITRNTDDPVEIQRRLHNAYGEIEQLEKYQYAVINDTIPHALHILQSIVTAEQQRTLRYTPHIV